MSEHKDLITLNACVSHNPCYINWHEGGGGEVWRIYDTYILFEVPQFGGEPQYVDTYKKTELSNLVDKAYTWT